jgi:hypothetical protein
VRQDWRFDIGYEGCNPGVAALLHLFLLFALFLAAAFAGQSFLHAHLLAGLQVTGVTLHFLK